MIARQALLKLNARYVKRLIFSFKAFHGLSVCLTFRFSTYYYQRIGMKSNLYKILHVITSMKIRVTIDLDKADESISSLFSDQSLTMGVFGCDKDGAYHMYFHNRTDLVSFENVKVLRK